MIATDARSVGANSNITKATGLTKPLLKSEICSKVQTPVPPTKSATRFEPLARRNKRANTLSVSRGSIQGRNFTESTSKYFGLEVRPEQVVWKGWEPGEEYTRNITLKNIHVKTQKIRYKIPTSRFFSTLFPRAIVLSAGTSFTLPVTFRPLEKEKYEDKIVFSTNQGSFNISLQALLPELNLYIPESVHFGLSAVHDTAELTFEIRNLSNELTADYTWEVPEPFTIIPDHGSLSPRASAWMRGIFKPTSARVFEATIICFYGENKKVSMTLEGIGKYPHLLISTQSKIMKEADAKDELLDFGSINVHEMTEKFIYLHNLSNVKAPFKFSKSPGTAWMDRAFTCHVKTGIVPPMGSIKFPIYYKPSIVGVTNIEYFETTATENISKSVLKCTGSCNGPNVQASTSSINFGIVKSENTLARSMHLTNDSDCEAIYQIDIDEAESIFCINNNNGKIPPHESITFVIIFAPTYNIIYHKRAIVLVHEQEPLFLDLVGTCHSADCQPPPLKLEHLQRYRVQVYRGLSFFSPDILCGQLKEDKLVEDSNGCLMLPGDKTDVSCENLTQSAMLEYFDDGHHTEVTHNPPHVSLSKTSVWFGEVMFISNKQATCHMTLQMTNHTKGKVVAMWIADPAGVFEVVPSTYEIPPMKSTDFRVVVKATAPNQFFGKRLECYAFYKCLRDYRLVDDKFVVPPWLLTVDVSGHTFNGKNEPFVPDVSLGSSNITFPPVKANESSFRTMLIENNGSTPLLYQHLKNDDHFTIKPSFGFSQSKYQLSIARFTPSKIDCFRTNVIVKLNDHEKHDEDVKLIGTGEQAELLLSNQGELFFRPTCVGTCTVRKYKVRNAGRFPARFKWVISHEEMKCISIKQSEGIMHPNEVQELEWVFKPKEFKKYVFKPICLSWPYNGNSDSAMDYATKNATKCTLRAVGEGTQGDIAAERSNIDFGSVIAGSSYAEPITLVNSSQCDLHFRLSLDQFINSQYGEAPDKNEPIGLKLNMWEGVVPARSKTTITAMAHAYRRVLYTWSLYYELLNSNGESLNTNCRYLICELSADGVYPSLAITDARSSGSGANISKTQLWRWFSLEHLNTCLNADPDKAELVYSVSTRHSTTRRPSVYTRSIMDFNFGAASLSSEPCYVSMMLKNTGSVKTEWAFLFPKDMELDIDYWAESGLFDTDELHELHIQDNKLFTVYPSRGVLNPGDTKTILLSYKHDVGGTHRLPVLLKVDKGKEILLNFTGVTVEMNRRYLHFAGTKHVFTPVPIGGPTPPKQLYEMYNGGGMAAIYEVDMAPLRLLETENYHHPILTCLNPRGEILPGTSANLEWIFSPLESKTYVVDIPIHIIGGDTALITFKGIGYDSRAMGASMPMLDQPPEYTVVPTIQKVPVPGQVLFLSEERISFGNIPLYGRSRHVVFLLNKSDDRPISYSWHATSEVVNDVLRVEPAQGYLNPGEKVVTKISFCAVGQPSFYDLDLVCEVVDEINMEAYHAELAAWEEEQKRQAVEFVILEEDCDVTYKKSKAKFYAGPGKFESYRSSPIRTLENVLNKHESPIRLTESKISGCSIKSEQKSYQTLPPIRFEDPVKLPSNRSRSQRHQEVAAANEWVQPQSPKPFIAHLGVTARTHDNAEFRTNFASEIHKHFLDRMLQIEHPVPSKPPGEEQYPLTTCNENEKEMVVSVMSDVIRGLLDDPTFHEAINDLEAEPTPFFTQVPRDDNLDMENAVNKADVSNIVDVSEQPSAELVTDYPIIKVSRQNSPTVLIDAILKQEETSANIGYGSDTSSTFEKPKISLKRRPLSYKRMVDEHTKTSPFFGTILEDILASTIGNIMEEAVKGEVLLTARPRVIALPPSRIDSARERLTSLAPLSVVSSSSGSPCKSKRKSISRVSISSKK